MLPLFAALFQDKTELQPDWITKAHQAVIAGQTVKYTTTVGLMPIRNARGEVEGRIFFTSYRRTDGPLNAKRPVTFLFNGGPGSASFIRTQSVPTAPAGTVRPRD